jgi:hypothetical protein
VKEQYQSSVNEGQERMEKKRILDLPNRIEKMWRRK